MVTETTVRVLLQVDVSGEASKYGVPRAVAIEELRRIVDLPTIRVEGLMTMAPFVDYVELARPVFARLRKLRDEIR